jgi:hypothetical protein
VNNQQNQQHQNCNSKQENVFEYFFLENQNNDYWPEHFYQLAQAENEYQYKSFSRLPGRN